FHLHTAHFYLYLYFLLILRTSVSTLFPYTTLFRSITIGIEMVADSYSPIVLCLLGAQMMRVTRSSLKKHVQITFYTGFCIRTLIDRKSTRLNSSHVKISYAVFCLKKKNKLDV